jgi:GT2 family glycosyltransferase
MLLQKRGGLGRSATIQFYPRFRPRIYAYEVNMAQPSVFWCRRVSDRVGGFDERMRYCGDFEYWLRTGAAGFRYTHVREVLAVEVDHEAALSHIHSDELRRETDRTRTRYAKAVRPRRFLPLRALTRLIHWRWQVLMLRLNLRRNHPSSWANFIRFLKRADVKLSGSSIIPLLLPLPLPRSWSMWEVDAAEFELKLIAELRSRCSGG